MKQDACHNTGCFILAGGGTGGHLYPGFSVAAAIKKLAPEAEILFLCTDRPFDQSQMPGCGYPYEVQPVRPLPSPARPVTWLPFLRGWFGSKALCRKMMTQRHVRAVLGLGGYASGPAMKVASELKLPTAMLNPDAVPGKANHFSARLADRIFVQWEETLPHFGRYASKCIVSGCPIRDDFSHKFDRHKACRELRLSTDKKTLVIVGGSQGGRNVNEAAGWCLNELGSRFLENWQVFHITGANDLDRTREFYRQYQLTVRTEPFVGDMPQLLGITDCLIGRAGASTLAELTAFGIPAILLPYPYHKDQHQLYNAQVLARNQGAKIVTDYCDLTRTGPELLKTMRQSLAGDSLEQMAIAAKNLARPGAADQVARHLIGLFE